MGKKTGRFIIQMMVIAVLYFVLTYIANEFQLANGLNFQLRISEALTVLPYYTPAAIPGLFIGCLSANHAMNLPMQDVVYGSIATLVSATISYLLRKNKYVVPIPPIIINAFAVPSIYTFLLGFDEPPFWRSVLLVGLGEAITCGVLGIALMLGLEDYRDKLFPSYSSDKADASSEKNAQSGTDEKKEATGDE